MQKCVVTHNGCVIVGLCSDNKKKLTPLGPLCLQMLWIWRPTEKTIKKIKQICFFLPQLGSSYFHPLLVWISLKYFVLGLDGEFVWSASCSRHLLGFAREGVSLEVNIVESGFGIMHFFYLHYPVFKAKPMYTVIIKTSKTPAI